MDVSVHDFSLDHGFFIDLVRTGRVVKKQSPGVSWLQGFYFRLRPLMSGERGAEITSDVQANHYRKRLTVSGLRAQKDLLSLMAFGGAGKAALCRQLQ